MSKFSMLFTFTLFSTLCLTQEQSDTSNSWSKKPTFKLSGFLDVYYFYDFNKPKTPYRQKFLYNHNRHNEFNLNLGFIKLAVEHPKYRANLALHAGTYVQDNYTSEQNSLKNVSEANFGISLSKKGKLWLDAGIMPSHIGFESAISIDTWTLSRSLLADNSPYYCAGAKLTYKPNAKWEFALLALNGWQRIQRTPGNSKLSFGSQLKYSKSDNFIFNWSTFIGTNDPDTLRRMRYFNNFYGQFALGKKARLIAGFDIGFQGETKANIKFDPWFSPVLIAQFDIHKYWKLGARLEYFNDQKGVIIQTLTPNGFQTTGTSLNIDYSPIPSLAVRLEARWFYSVDKIFDVNANQSENNFFIGTSVALKFPELSK